MIPGAPDQPDEVLTNPPSGRTVLTLAMIALVVVCGLGGAALWWTGSRPASVSSSPDPGLLDRPEVVTAEHSVVKLVGTAPGCRRRMQSTGFVYAPERVMTNAHSVAGSQGPIDVLVPTSGAHYSATVVLFDPQRDVAVLAVPELPLAPLPFDTSGGRGDPAVIAGFPKDATTVIATAARIRARQTSTSADIYHSVQNVRRDIFSLTGTVRAGDSGAPLLSAEGAVYGLVFAAESSDPGAGYALTAGEIAGDAQNGRIATDAVPTGGCD